MAFGDRRVSVVSLVSLSRSLATCTSTHKTEKEDNNNMRIAGKYSPDSRHSRLIE